ncbi:MAG: hypothetical protein IMF26_05260 [Candidatus Fermentithermobacillus carboniphilus]|uniref:Uncharacterized protein n=1 Tax=Candidatus Fermentithermobacillus carboniphilus TaxID=3085328 RepID=A0AAT9LI00_9FIRM|nr:MAG: hypothetical protein IMF26_05260 [Candidatus Fermentithermobacillus carboniphilus]
MALFTSRKGGLTGRLLLAGTLGYFLYTYASYACLAMYNEMFLVYVALFSTSFAAFTLTMMSFDLQRLAVCISNQLPVRFVGGFLILISVTPGI